MATAPQEVELPDFTTWLGDVTEKRGLTYGKLHFALVRFGYPVTPEAVRRWTRGLSQPPASAVPVILAALQSTETGRFDYRKSYDRWLDSFERSPRTAGVRGAGSLVPVRRPKLTVV